MSSQSNFFRPLSLHGPYRFNPRRALPPRVLAAARFLRLLQGEEGLKEEEKESFNKCLHTLNLLSPVVQTGFMERKMMFRLGFVIDTIWSHTPFVSDIFVVTAPEDVGFCGIGYQYGKTGDEALFDTLTAIPLPYLN